MNEPEPEPDLKSASLSTAVFPELMTDPDEVQALVAMVLGWIRGSALVGVLDPWEIISELAVYLGDGQRNPKRPDESWEDYVKQKLWDRFRTEARRSWREKRKGRFIDHEAVFKTAASPLDRICSQPAPDYVGLIARERESQETAESSDLPAVDPLCQQALRAFERLVQTKRVKRGEHSALFESILLESYDAAGEDTFNRVAERHIESLTMLTATQKESLRKKLHKWKNMTAIALAAAGDAPDSGDRGEKR